MKTFQQPLSAKDEACYLQIMQSEDRQAALEARRILIERNLRLVAHVAKKYAGAGEEMEDLISIGTIGLIKAISTFRPEKGSILATYAAKCIDNAILSQMRLWFHINPPEQKRAKMAYFGTGYGEYIHPLFHFGRLCEVCTYVYP